MTHDLIVLSTLFTASYYALKWADGRLKQINKRGRK